MAAVSAYLAVRGRAPGQFFVFEGGEPLSMDNVHQCPDMSTLTLKYLC